MIKWLKKPYLLVSSIKFNLTISFIIACFIFLFLYIFQPFGINNMKNNPLTYTLGFGFVTLIAQIIVLIIIPRIFKNAFKDENWTVGKNILFLTSLILFIAILNWTYNNNVQIISNEAPLISFPLMISYTFTVGVFPILFITFVTEKVHNSNRLKKSKELMKLKAVTKRTVFKEKTNITIFANNKKDAISFKLDELIYISSQGNYASFFLNSTDGIREHILRNTLANILSYLEKYDAIVRCHKSYIVNTNHINSISGNARGYYLISSLIHKQIPVSRKFSRENLLKLIN